MNNKVKVGVITIGQSPRTDLTEDIRDIVKDKFEIIEKGALDGYDLEYIKKSFAPEKNSTVLVSRMRDGAQVILAEEKILPIMQRHIDKLEEMGCDIVVLLCTGKFPEFHHKNILIYPQKLVHKITEIMVEEGTLGIVVPSKDQVDTIERMWKDRGVKVKILVASPYLEISELKNNCETLKDTALILMDCMGYSGKMKKIVKDITEKVVILPRNLTFAIVSQMVS